MAELGPRAVRVYQQMRHLIDGGSWPPGMKLPTIVVLAGEFGIAPATMRLVQDRLEEEGRIRRVLGRGTYVQEPVAPAVLVVDDEPQVIALVAELISQAGFRAVEASDPDEGIAALQRDPTIVLVLSDVRMPQRRDGIEFIRMVRQRWPDLPVAAVTGFPQDLTELNSMRECPALVILKPIQQHQIEDALRLVTRPHPPRDRVGVGPVLVADDDDALRMILSHIITNAGREVEEVQSGDEARTALRRRHFGHVFLDLRMPGGGVETAAGIIAEHPSTAVVLITGFPEDVVGQLHGPYTVLPKPFHSDEVLDALRLRIAP